jgi:bacterial/archaeal transporter family-2 protein
VFTALAPLVGILITVMNGINSRFAGFVGSLVATAVIHIVGLCGVSALLLFKKERAEAGTLPFYYYLGGLVGVGTVFCNNYSFSALGASLAVALGLLGQTLFSVTADATGFMGRKKYPFSARRVPGLALALAGIAVMAGNWRSNVLAMGLALFAGALPGLSFVLNSELGRRKGILRSTRINYVVGLAATLLIVAVARPPLGQTGRALASAGPLLALCGGLMGVVVVAAMNFIFPRIAALSATLLLFCGQALAGILIDFATSGHLDTRKLLGLSLLLLGLALNGFLTRRTQAAAAATAATAAAAAEGVECGVSREGR